MSREILDIVLRGEVIFGLLLVLLFFGVVRTLLRSSAETARLRLELRRVDLELGRLHEELPAKRSEAEEERRLFGPVQTEYNQLQSFHTNAKRAYAASLKKKEQEQEGQSQGPDIATGQQRREGRI